MNYQIRRSSLLCPPPLCWNDHSYYMQAATNLLHTWTEEAKTALDVRWAIVCKGKIPLRKASAQAADVWTCRDCPLGVRLVVAGPRQVGLILST